MEIGNAPINVFPDPREGGHLRAFDLSSQLVSRDFDFTKPIKSLKLHYTMIQFLIISITKSWFIV